MVLGCILAFGPGILLAAGGGTEHHRFSFLERQEGAFSCWEVRQRRVKELAVQSRLRKETALRVAAEGGWSSRDIMEGKVFELMAVEEDRPVVYKTCNANAAISIAVDLIRNTQPYDLTGQGLTVGIWDGGAVRATHHELSGRVLVRDGASEITHATHVAGTIGAAGITLSAMGMAPNVQIDSYDWNGDESEMAARAMSSPIEPETLPISNHSYGQACGWETTYTPPRWFGTWSTDVRESDWFGRYDSQAALWDQICYDAPYFLPCKAAGNDRIDAAPSAGQTFQYYWKNKWHTAVYDSSTHPYSDNWDQGGFDTIDPVGTAKNILTVGAVSDAVTGGLRDLSEAAMSSFSSWGPTDDGRIKPDLVTNGVALYSTTDETDSSYAVYSGTSMAAPGAAGAAVLLTEYYRRLSGGTVMRAATLKGLLIHTADDLGTPGPDYKFGWGLMNAKAAAEQIRGHFEEPALGKIRESFLSLDRPQDFFPFRWDGIQPIRATLCWTDPAATAVSGLDDPSLRLVNDLDLRIIDPNGVVYLPYVLDPAQPAQPAAFGDNIRDNVEQVFLSSPTEPGWYLVHVSYKRTLQNGIQYYSLVLSGQAAPIRLRADYTRDGVVDCNDLSVLAGHWLSTAPEIVLDASDPNGIIDWGAFSILSEEWLERAWPPAF